MVKLMNFIKKVSQIYLLTLTFLLPLKFAGIAIMPETSSYFPSEIWEYIIVNFPNNSLGIFSGIGLIAAIISYGNKLKGTLNLFLYISLAILSILGVFNASTGDYIYLSLGHIWGVLSYTLSIYLLVKDDKNNLSYFYNIATISLIFTLLVGFYQYFIGFEEQIEFYKSQKVGMFEVDLSNKLMEKRIYSTFGGCNVYAGYLLLILGIALCRINKFSSLFQPQKLSQWLFIVLFSLSYLFIIFNTGSRAVVAGVGASLIIIIFLSKISSKIKIFFGIILLSFCGIGIWATQFLGRNFASFTERIGYAKSSLMMLYNHFFLGSGWGDFLVDNQKYRFIESSEAARDPHNIFFTFGSQAGIFALLAVMGCFLVPLICLAIKYYRKNNLHDGVILFSLFAFLIHAMLDVDYQIPAIFSLSGAIFITLNTDDEKVLVSNKHFKRFLLFLMALIGFLAFRISYYNTVAEKKYDEFISAIQNNSIIFEVERKYNELEKIKPYSPFHKIKMYQFLRFYYQNKSREFLNQKVLPYLLEAVKNSPERSGYYRYLSDYYLQVNKDVNTAKKYFDKSLELAPYTKNLK